MVPTADAQQQQLANSSQQQPPQQIKQPQQPQQPQTQQQLYSQMHPAYQQQLYMNYQMAQAQAQGRMLPYWQPVSAAGMGRGMPMQGMGGPVGAHPAHPHAQAAAAQQVIGKQTAVPGGVPGR